MDVNLLWLCTVFMCVYVCLTHRGSSDSRIRTPVHAERCACDPEVEALRRDGFGETAGESVHT